ncbi:MAG: outer membrane protein assembly factor BamD [Desulfomonilaceae bacterium]
MNILKKLALLILVVICLSGCPSLWNTAATEKNVTPDEMFARAEKLIKEKNYDDAIETLERLKSAHPDYSKIEEVYLKIADAAFEKGSYENAASKYYQFMELYPASKQVPRAKFNVAMCYFKQIKGTDLDNRVIQQAVDAFKTVADDPNAGEWAKKAEEKIRECRRKLAEKELYKAKTYISVGNYKAARVAAQRVLDEYAKVGLDEDAQKLLKSIKNK